MITTVLLYDDNLGLSIKDKIKNLQTLEGIEFESNSSGNHSGSSAEGLNFICLDSANDLKNILDSLRPQKTAFAASHKNANLNSELAITYLGIQRQLVSKQSTLNPKNLHLNDILGNIKVTEPAIRDSELFIFDMNVLRASETNHAEFSNPSGIYSEEATQMFRYAGMSEVNKSVIILNAKESNIKLLTQFVWYYAEAASDRFPDHPYFKETVHQYVVNMPSIDGSISFFKSKATGRWWVKTPGTEENRWLACNYQDYADACNDEISPLILGMLASAE